MAANPVIDLGTLNPKQKLFCQSRAMYVAYGGARGGGKTHVARNKALGGCLRHPGLRVLFIRRHYSDLEQTIIMWFKKMIPDSVAKYNGETYTYTFTNGSVLKFGHYRPGDEDEYQGQEWDWIFLDEATQFTEYQFRILGACLRGTTDVPRRMYLTCNPGGVGHLWVKRLFIDRDFKPTENPKDYEFIPATVEDNPQLLKSSPAYMNMLDNLPADIRKAWRYGDWDALAGGFFPEFRREVHVIPDFDYIPDEWTKFRAFDYGLDMFACLWIARDFKGRSYVYRELHEPGLIVSEAAAAMRRLTPAHEAISTTYGPPDMWARQKDTGRSMAEIFAVNGVGITKASNSRVQGWLSLKELLKPMNGDGDRPGLLICKSCETLIRYLPAIQHDQKNPSDCATEPHEITHICDALRYYAVSHTISPEETAIDMDDFPANDNVEAYDDFMTGGEAGEDYLTYGG